MAIYELVSVMAFIAALWWSVRSRNPMCLGALIGGTLLFGFDWFWCGRSFFNATFSPDLTMIPGLHIQGQTYPVAAALNWGVGFGFVPFLISQAHGSLSKHLRAWYCPVVLVVAAIFGMAVEIPMVSGLGMYTYHQAPEYLIYGVPWSNIWFNGMLVGLSYFGLVYAQKWAALPEGCGFALCSENTWKGFTMAAAALWSALYFSGVIQLFWYSAVTPWVESGRLF